MSTLTERGASSSSMNLTNSSTRLLEGDPMQNPRTGNVFSASFSAPAEFKAPTSSRPIQLFPDLDFEVMSNISTLRSSPVERFANGHSKADAIATSSPDRKSTPRACGYRGDRRQEPG